MALKGLSPARAGEPGVDVRFRERAPGRLSKQELEATRERLQTTEVSPARGFARAPAHAQSAQHAALAGLPELLARR